MFANIFIFFQSRLTESKMIMKCKNDTRNPQNIIILLHSIIFVTGDFTLGLPKNHEKKRFYAKEFYTCCARDGIT